MSIFTGESHDERRHLTAVAAHPTEFIVATGNRIGEIFIWYGLAIGSAAMNSTDWLSMLLPNPDILEDDADSGTVGTFPSHSADAQFDDIRQLLLEKHRKNHILPYCPVHPSRVRKNLLHWHCQIVTSLCFTPTGSHLLSGGLERVLVKWDMTECLGGPRQRRFLPRLSAPIQSIDSPGGPSEDTIVMTLSSNGLLIDHQYGFQERRSTGDLLALISLGDGGEVVK
ncbi:unnamed protein product [Echinostoma caproni]|uniref:WD_REPEATS_REGION domain-containing protein n=1 Tax=Echinostoma caproni TaxID=27848 RepID=A0A3P8J0R8_9TREM|nr:unnamed protein product [Echinostoma caproni]